MTSVATIIMILLSPLNPLLLVQGTPAYGNASEKVGQIMGVEKKREMEKPQPPKPVIPSPRRNADAKDLVIPTAHASLILDAASGSVLHYNKGKERRQIASLTKMMTAVLVMEKVKNLNEDVVIAEEDVMVEGTRIGCPRTGYCVTQRLKVGERISVHSLLKAMLMNSANDAANALGRHIGGSRDEFVNMMNVRAKELGLNDSNFCTPSGLEIDGKESECYSTAYDIAKIAAHSLQFDAVWNIFRLPNHTIITSSDGKLSHTILNTDQVMDRIPNCMGGKTGFTPLAGKSLLMASKDPTSKHKVVAVILNDEYRWENIRKMFDWTFKSYTWETN